MSAYFHCFHFSQFPSTLSSPAAATRLQTSPSPSPVGGDSVDQRRWHTHFDRQQTSPSPSLGHTLFRRHPVSQTLTYTFNCRPAAATPRPSPSPDILTLTWTHFGSPTSGFVISLTTMVRPILHHCSLLLISTSIFLTLLVLATAEQEVEDPAVSRYREYLRINTAHPHPDYPAAVSFLNDLARSIPNLQTRTLYLTTPHKPILVVTFPGFDPSLPSILLNSHLDSVPAEPAKWFHPPFSAVKTHEGRIFARGAQDDKCIAIQYLEAIRNILVADPHFQPLRTIHICYVPDEEIGGFDGMAKFVESNDFKDMNVGFFLDEGQASTNDEYRVFYADRSPWSLVIKAAGMPGHGSRMFDNSALENLMKSVEVVSRFRENQFDLVKAGVLANSEVISANPVYLKAGIPSGSGGFAMNMQPSEAEAGFDVRLPPTADPYLMRKRIADEWAPASRNMSYHIVEKGPLRDYMGRPLMTATNDSNPWWAVFKHAIKACGGKLSKPEILASTTDARYLRVLGIPVLGFSPMKNTPILLHDHNEFLKDTVFLEGIKVYESIIKALSTFENRI